MVEVVAQGLQKLRFLVSGPNLTVLSTCEDYWVIRSWFRNFIIQRINHKAPNNTENILIPTWICSIHPLAEGYV